MKKSTLTSTLALALISSFALAQVPPSGSSLKRVEALRSDAELRKRIAVSLISSKGLQTRTELPNGKVFEVMRLRNGRPAFLETLGFEADDTVGADELWTGGSSGLNLDGGGIAFGEWDAGRADGAHAEFQTSGASRIFYSDSATRVDSHSTHVAGIMTATGLAAAAKGMSYLGSVKSYDWNSDFAEMASAADAGLIVSNHSYGYVCGWSNNFLGDGRWAWLGDPAISATEDWQFGFYSDESRTLDDVLYNHPGYLAVWAAGNSRGGAPTSQPVDHWEWSSASNTWVLTSAVRGRNGVNDGYDSLTIGLPVAKNNLTVAAVSPIAGGYNNPSGVSVAGFSSAGPTDDGRIKPDVAAPGVNIYSTLPNQGYGNMSGTSMAAPSAAGAIGLLAQLHRRLLGTNPLAATLKALLIHTADQVGPNPGPNYRSGWGLINALHAANVLTNAAQRKDTIYELVLNSGQMLSIPVMSDGTAPLKATIVWGDPAGSVSAPALNVRTPKLVNDLNLRVRGAGVTYFPWILNPDNPAAAATTGDNTRDNVEQVTIPAPAAGLYILYISARSSNLLPAGTQAFTCIVTGHQASKMQSVTLSPSIVVGDGTKTSSATVRLTAPAPQGGTVVSLSSSNSAARIAPSVTISAGSSAVAVPISTSRVSSNQTAVISASYLGLAASANLSIKAP